jgi:hypothetical protein
MQYIIITEAGGAKYYVKLFNTTCELRGLKDHATIFDDRQSAEYWKRQCEIQKPHNSFRVVDKTVLL